MTDLFDTAHIYVRVVRKGSKNTRIELPDHTTQMVPNEELINVWKLDPTKAEGYIDPSPKVVKSSKSRSKYSSNGLGIDHPFSQLEISNEVESFQKDFKCPFCGDDNVTEQ